jgi:hypothetical protein
MVGLRWFLNNSESFVYDDIILKNGMFWNYFKAGNYFQSKNPDSYGGAVKFMLEVTH